jgi:hypothetical protein
MIDTDQSTRKPIGLNPIVNIPRDLMIEVDSAPNIGRGLKSRTSKIIYLVELGLACLGDD